MSAHPVHIWYADGYFSSTVDCPDQALGAKRPCAVWADDDGTTRKNECTFQQYAEATGCLEDWLSGNALVGTIFAEDNGFGDGWSAVVVESK